MSGLCRLLLAYLFPALLLHGESLRGRPLSLPGSRERGLAGPPAAPGAGLPLELAFWKGAELTHRPLLAPEWIASSSRENFDALFGFQSADCHEIVGLAIPSPKCQECLPEGLLMWCKLLWGWKAKP